VQSGVRITLRKMIPVAAGLGGGSADAAAVLRGLARLWTLDLNRIDLREIGNRIGADVPVCIESSPAMMEGRGERVTLLPELPAGWLLLVNPGVAVSTAQVFNEPRQSSGLGLSCPTSPFADVFELVGFLRSTTNDLELPARSIARVIGEVLKEIVQLPEVLLARMSGSGATCFGIFASQGAARSAMVYLQEKHTDWWVVATPFAPTAIGVPQPS